MYMYLGEQFSDVFKDISAVESTVKVDIELSHQVGQVTQLVSCKGDE